ncbi:MAG: MogA/MoaB family molybdenum cofactor biosynthesis protein [Thermoprotei archaeon]
MSIGFYVVIVSDRVYSGEARDTSGELATRLISDRGYSVCGKTVIPNRERDIIRVIREIRECDVLVFIGGTGLSPRDVTVDTLESLSWRKIPGFGEYFRLKSFEGVGARGLLSRAEAYILGDGRVAVALPGSPGAVELGLGILLNMIEHLVQEVRRFEEPHHL